MTMEIHIDHYKAFEEANMVLLDDTGRPVRSKDGGVFLLSDPDLDPFGPFKIIEDDCKRI